MDTIFALSTAPGKSGVAVIRVSGPGAKDTLSALGVPLPSPRLATLAALKSPVIPEARESKAQALANERSYPESSSQDSRFRGNDNTIIDHALVLYFPAPHSFTGEDVVEYHTHGSRAVIKTLLAALGTLPSLRPAEPGEFARRAFLNGKMDLTSAEGLADLIDAETEAQRKQAVRLMQGEAAQFYETLRASMLSALSCLEAYIDFPDEDISPEVLAEIKEEVGAAIRSIRAQLAGAGASERIRDGVHVAILGPPNVGKSSLMNLLAKRDVAIVSPQAGTTRDIIEVHLDIAGYAVILCDTAGLREKAGDIEQEGIRRALARAERADIKIVMLDAQNTNNEQRTTNLIDSNTLLVLNKSDLGLPSPPPVICGQTPIPVSVKDKTGIDTLLEALRARVEAACPPEASFVTQARHRAHLEAALLHLKHYVDLQSAGLELRCEELRRAATEIGKITGRIAVDELLSHIFSRFCIGK